VGEEQRQAMLSRSALGRFASCEVSVDEWLGSADVVQEVASAVEFLAGARAVTGQVIRVDCGVH
jgi:hypothetical protein